MHSGYQKLAYNHTFVKKIRRLFKKPLFWGTSHMATSNPKADSERPRKTALVGGVKHIYMASIADFRPNNRRMELYPSSFDCQVTENLWFNRKKVLQGHVPN